MILVVCCLLFVVSWFKSFNMSMSRYPLDLGYFWGVYLGFNRPLNNVWDRIVSFALVY